MSLELRLKIGITLTMIGLNICLVTLAVGIISK